MTEDFATTTRCNQSDGRHRTGFAHGLPADACVSEFGQMTDDGPQVA